MLKVYNLLYKINIFKSGSVTFLHHRVVNFILFSRNLLALKTIYWDCLSFAEFGLQKWELRIYIYQLKLDDGLIPHDKIVDICTICNENIGDEFHILFRCKNQNIITLREFFLPIYYYNNPDMRKKEGSLSYCNCQLLKMLSLFIKKVSVLL